jgi:aminocarboxymuconate-semialdehyde decarboxylase
MIHPSYAGGPSPFPDFYMKNLLGNPLATTVAASRMILSGFLDRHPRLIPVLVHAGGYLPYQIGRLDHGYRVREETRARAAGAPSTYLRRFRYDTISHAPAPLRFLVDLVGEDRVVLGTDIPFDMGDLAFEAIMRGAGLGAAATRAIEGENARGLFAL